MISVATPSVYPIKDDPVVSPERRSTDVSRLKFPLGMVAAIVGTAIGIVTSQQIGQASLKSDMRDILTRMELSAKVSEADKRAQDVIYDTLQQSVKDLKGQVQLLQLQYGELTKQMQQKGSR